MAVRNIVGLAASVFVVVGIFGWIAGMPQAAPDAAAVSGPPELSGPAVAATPEPEAVTVAPGSSTTDTMVSSQWLISNSASTGIPLRVLQAYAAAALTQAKATPTCGLSWNTIAAIGAVESANGTEGGASIDASGQLVGSILGPVLDGHGVGTVPDTDGGLLDGNTRWDRAVGPMQFIPSTWAQHGEDGNGDGKADPNQIDDAALSTAAYLCSDGARMSTPNGWVKSIRAFNHNDNYVNSVRAQANVYAKDVN